MNCNKFYSSVIRNCPLTGPVLACSCTMGWVTGRGGPSGRDHLDVVGGVEAHLAAEQPPFTPALLVLLSQLQQLLAWKEHDRKSAAET